MVEYERGAVKQTIDYPAWRTYDAGRSGEPHQPSQWEISGDISVKARTKRAALAVCLLILLAMVILHLTASNDAVFQAVYDGDAGALRTLIAAGSDISRGATHDGFKYHQEILGIPIPLWKKRPSKNMLCGTGYGDFFRWFASDSPLHIAVREDHVKILETLLEAKADVNAKDKWGGVRHFIWRRPTIPCEQSRNCTSPCEKAMPTFWTLSLRPALM